MADRDEDADRLTLRVDGRGQRGEWVADVEVTASVEAWSGSTEELKRDLTALGLSPGLGGYRIRDDREITEWGASSTVITIALSVGGWLAGSIGYDLAKATLLSMIKSQAGQLDPVPLTRDEAQQWARWRLEARYGLSADDLVCIDEEEDDDGNFHFVFEAQDGRRAEVDLEDTEGLVHTTRTRLQAAGESTP